MRSCQRTGPKLWAGSIVLPSAVIPPRLGSATGLVLGRAVAVDPNLRWAGGSSHRASGKVQNVDPRVPGDRRGRVDDPEESTGLEIEITQLPVLWLAGSLADGVDPLGNLASLLGGGQRLELKRPDIESGVHAEVIGRDGGGDEARLWWLEGDGSDFDRGG